MKTKIKIAVADDHAIFRQGFISLLKQSGFNNIVFEAADAKEVFENLKIKKADILFLDIEMPDTKGKGTGTLEKVKRLYPETRVIILSGHYQDRLIVEFIKKGGSSFLSKDCDFQTLIKTVETVHKTGLYYDEKITSLMPEILETNSEDNKEELTESERNIIALLCNDLSHQEIADKLRISKRTIDHHRESIKKKTGCHTLLEMVKYAQSNNIIDLDL